MRRGPALWVRYLIVTCILLCGLAQPRAAQAPLAEYELGTGWATMGLALPSGAAPDAVQVGTLPTQTDVKTRWADGSIRFAVVTARVDSRGHYPIRPVEAAPRSFVSIPPRVAASFLIEGRRWTATFPRTSTETWLSGPLVREVRAVVAPTDGLQAHPFLRVIFDVRSYVDRSARVDVTVENVLDVAEADAVTYDVELTVDGARVFARTAVEHGYLARWRTVVPVGLEESAVTPDFTPFILAGALPAYSSIVTDGEYSTAGPAFDILGTGGLTLPMDEHGGRPELAPYPDWTAQYLVHRRPDQRAYVLAHGDLAGSFGVHLKEPDGIRPLSIDDHPEYWLDERAEPGLGPANGLRGQAVGGDNAHQPSLAYVPYLITGDRYYADEMRYWANYCLLRTFQDTYYNARDGRNGLLRSNQVRGMGWALRNLADTVYLPDDDPSRRYFMEKVTNNLRWFDEYARQSEAPLDVLFAGRRPEDDAHPPYTWVAVWEQAYLAWAIDHAESQGFQGGELLRDAVVRFQLSLLTSEGEGYPREYGAPYVLAVGTKRDPGVTYFDSLQEIFTVTFGHPPSTAVEFGGYYGPEARLMLLIARAQRMPGAVEALEYLLTPGNQGAYPEGSLYRDLKRRSGWAIVAPDVLEGGDH